MTDITTYDAATLVRLREIKRQVDAAISLIEAGEAMTFIDNTGRTAIELKAFKAGTLLVGGFAIQERFPKWT
jgi:hypothetical protein